MTAASLIGNSLQVTGRHVLPGFALSLGISLLFISLVLLLPQHHVTHDDGVRQTAIVIA